MTPSLLASAVTRQRLRDLGISELGIAQFGCLPLEHRAAILALLDQYEHNHAGTARFCQ